MTGSTAGKEDNEILIVKYHFPLDKHVDIMP